MNNRGGVGMFQRCSTRSGNFSLVIQCAIVVLLGVFLVTPRVYGQSSVSSQSTTLNGIAKYTHLGKEQFFAGLFSETLTASSEEFLQAEEVKRLEVKVLAPSISPRLFRQLWIEAVAINASSNELNKHAQNLADFSNFLKPRMRAGDILMIDRTVDSGVTITLNNIRLGTVKDKTFFDLLARAWVGAVPLSSKFRDGLLQGGDVSVDLRSDYLSVFPSDNRIEDIKSFVINEENSRNKKKLAVRDVPIPSADNVAAMTKALPKKATVSKSATLKAPETKAPATVIDEAVKKPVLAKPVLANTEPSIPDVVIGKMNQPATEDTLGDPVAAIAADTDDEDSPGFVYTAERLLAKQLYIAKLSRWTFPFVQYPKSAQRNGQEGSLVLKVVVARNGKVTGVSIVEGSGFSILDKAAIAAVKKASPYPAIPEDIRKENFSFNVPIAFGLQG